MCASFQRVVVDDVGRSRTFDAARRWQARSIGIAGGVSANSRLRADLKAHGDAREIRRSSRVCRSPRTTPR